MPQLTKYIFVSGGVLSGLGKGTVAASLGYLLKSHGLRVALIKCENYLNYDSGLINPIEHGDPFLCEDGAETDMDLGTYERFLDQNLGSKNFITMGQIYKAVIDKERNFFYKGEDVEAIPHVTDEIISRFKAVANAAKADVVVIELGGTAGEYQNALYYEAARIMKLKHQDTVVHIHVTYLPTPKHLGEPKTKPTQLSVKYLNSMGIQPDFIVCRAEGAIDKRRQARLALFCNLPEEGIISAPDLPSVYELPLVFAKQQFSQKVLNKLNLKVTPLKLEAWQELNRRISRPKKQTIKIAIVGKYFATGDYQLNDSYASLYEALNHATWAESTGLQIVAINSEREKNIKEKLSRVDGVIVPIGWGPRGTQGMIEAIRYSRENRLPFLGLCFGMQLAVVEFSRNVLGLKEASSTEIDPQTKFPVIHIIPEQTRNLKLRAYGGTMRLGSWDCRVKPGTIAFSAYGKTDTSERHRHRYEVNEAYVKQLEAKGLIISGRSVKENLVEIVELPQKIHPFFLGTQGHPEYKSRPLTPHPVFLKYIQACAERSRSVKS
ncbi:MAG: CTP synthase [Candidatus Beckwithbacteria bacterium]|nr:CTP synthase [Candidatus Beckwithbacteria bacterium]